jgi:outer membrane receptor for ferrienterochelin and colicin
MRFLRVLPLVLVLLITSAAVAQMIYGDLTGTVTLGGNPLPGTTVTITSPALQGSRTAVTDVNGNYNFGAVPPGDYTVQFQMESMQTVTKTTHVGLSQTARLDAAMQLTTVSEAMTVVADAPLLDTQSASIDTNLGTRAIETLPTGRNYSSIAQVVPGVASDAHPGNKDQNTITVYGSSGAENAYYIDGVNTTNLEYGFQGKELNFEFIREVNVKTGGYEAEFGRATGGIVNVITKSGGNELTGDVFGYRDSDSLQTDAKPVVDATLAGFTRTDYGVDLGGALMHDKLWFFAAYDRVQNSIDFILPDGPRAGSTETSDSDRDLGSAKLTYNLAAGQSLVFTFLQDPRVDTGAINDASHTLIGDPSTYLGRQDFGGHDYALRYDGALGGAWVVSAQAAQHEESNSVGPSTSAGDAIQYRDAANNFYQTGGFGLVQDKNFKRQHYAGSAMRLLGNHEIKGGVEYEDATADVTKEMSGGQQVTIFANDVNPSKKIYSHFYWTTPSATIANAPTSQLNASPEHKITSVYLQDRWNVNSNLVLSYGVRWDKQEIIDASGVTQINLDKDFAPRLGLVWDPDGTHKSRVFASYGRYYEEIPMDLVIRSFSYERQPRIINYSPTSTAPDPAAEADFDTASAILGGFTEPSDPNIENQYINEYILGYEREVRNDLAFGIKGIYRNYGQVIEDFLCADDGTYCIGNPGEGIMKQAFTLDYSQQFDVPKAKRVFKGVQLTATKRFSNNWQAIASYLYSKLDGNFDGEYAPFTNVGADPNITAAYDYYDFFTNGSDLTKITNRGPLSNDRRHSFKVSGTYETPWKLSVGAAAYWRSGTPVTRYGYSDAYGRYEFFLTERGAEGRTPSNYDVDVHLGYPIDLAHGVRVNLLLDVFSLLDTQRAILLDQRWGFEEADNLKATPTNPDYKKPVLRTAPTSARFGVRVSF